jgi:Fe-S-cluster containining protein
MSKAPASNDNDQQPWYKDGLRFKCTGCGDCCTGSPGYVWVNQAEINAMAALLGLEIADFETRFVRQIGVRRSLIEFPNYDCVFLDSKTRKCQVYEHRPRQCRTWPFWKSNLSSPKAWDEMCETCPGSGKGKLYQLGEIEEQAAVFRV